ncbi:glycosyl transferase family 2 [Sphingobium sp. TA15]|uniref:Chitooligosaccharide deacetylase n=1 Tax=Sphingobium indicum (strain DSM 16413 / CCM 7287 / MTCC 6362 / UT26 / NBRC 101211 / UT26S) TaxID=452662 RepID=D4YYX1_SPHIU|nr:glycosyltransferase [Sphingobium indicum]BAI95553.1 putative bi-functional transferase/deacetylase [Sphingobium indicum UT26S]BDD68331.1 glycosyl transferase family 2 [Sphingobium sp. TA15]
MIRPIFFDPTGRRGLWARRLLAGALLLILLAAIAFATTLVAVPSEGDLALPLPQPHAARLSGISSLRRGIARWLPRWGGHRAQARPLNVGFYMPGDESSIASLRRHVGQLDWVVPALISVPGAGKPIHVAADAAFDRMIAAMPRPPRVLPMVQNIGSESWDGAGAARLLRDAVASRALARQLGGYVARRHEAGLVMDFESLPDSAMPGYLRFLRMLRVALPQGAKIALTVPAGEQGWPLARFAAVADRVILMDYDQHWQSGQPGPIAAQGWFARQAEAALRAIGADRILVALGSYAYDWHGGTADALSLDEAWLAAHDSAARPLYDAASGNAGFAYDEAGVRHQIWMLDAAASWNELLVLKRLGIRSVALWRLGSEDPGFWADLTAWRTGGRPKLGTMASTLNTDVEGSGEILRITATPAQGHRAIAFGPQGTIEQESYGALPTPYQVERAGGQDRRMLALTFDDGPDAEWTPKILNVLESTRTPATFFVIGENALEHPGLLQRIVADGDEIGNHTYDHPNLATWSEEPTRLQLNATQRLVQAYTGRGMRLFRAPYFGDAEPTTADELGPALAAQKLGYTVVGLHVDPNDWQRPGADAIVRQVIDQVHAASDDRSENIILLHDGGGERSQTVAALPRIIAQLRAEGYRFVPVSQLAGIPAKAAMPPVEAGDLLAVRVDVAAFVALATLSALLGWIFYVAISLGLARAVLMTFLAWFQARRGRPAPPDHQPTVSVIIPAYNEARVIESSVRRVLASQYPGLQLIVADDGSRDATSAIVAQAFADDPRVTLLTLPNGGKAAALNRALAQATGEIVIALDADTQFEPQTIARLARWFADPALGAVAGDARVGNRVNLVTRWQAVEYITAQNLERRALAGFDAMTVVPGAVGAWRRAALDAVGGYPEDTLAEDQDLTIAIQRAGWRVTFDPEAVAWTEAPESFRALARQRYRWAFGTLQCLWKHRRILRERRPTGLALVGLPQAWLFQIMFAAISPLIDLALVASILGTIVRVNQHGWAQTSGDVWTMGLYWLAFTAIDMLCGWAAYALDNRGMRYPPHLLVAQRFVYRQIMYGVVVRAIASAIGGWVVGWGKLKRTGRVAVHEGPAAA